MKSLNDVFEKVLEYYREKVEKDEVTSVFYDTWIATITPLKFENNTVYLSVPTQFHCGILKNYESLIVEGFSSVLGFDVNIDISISEGEQSDVKAPAPSSESTSVHSSSGYEGSTAETARVERSVGNGGGSDYAYTFDTFIVGGSNEFAYAACTAVAKSKSTDKAYNPLFIYSPSGMGKTHLLNAIYNEVRQNQPEKNVILVTGEAFATELINYIGKKDTTPFKQKYRNTDVLLIDDIHFIAGKDTTQEEFFHTFNDLYNKGKQIVITSDRPPKEIKTLESRIRTRFESGIIADITTPEYETRFAIIKRKADLLNFVIPNDVIEYIANRLKSSVRQLEGCVKKMKAYQELVGTQPTIAQAQNAIREILTDDQPSPITVDKIVMEVANVYGVVPDDIRSNKRSGAVSTARKVCAYVIKETMQISYNQIGSEIGGKDHSTVVYYINDIKKAIESDPRTKELVNDIINNIKAE